MSDPAAGSKDGKDSATGSGRDKRPVGEVLEKLFTEAEKNVEEAVKKALAKVKVPRHGEIAALNARLDELNRRVEALSK